MRGLAWSRLRLFDRAHIGRWYCIEARARLNDPGRLNGVFELWIDDCLEAQQTGLGWMESHRDYGINVVHLENCWNDGDPQAKERYSTTSSSAPSVSAAFDNLRAQPEAGGAGARERAAGPAPAARAITAAAKLTVAPSASPPGTRDGPPSRGGRPERPARTAHRRPRHSGEARRGAKGAGNRPRSCRGRLPTRWSWRAYMSLGVSRTARRPPYLQAVELEPRMTEPYRMLAALYANTKRYDHALARLGDALKTNPRDGAALMITGVIYEQRGDTAKARDPYEKVLALDPRSPAAANNLGWIYSEYGGDKDRALQLAQLAKEVAPDDPRISDTLGWILYKRGVYQRALALLKESATKLPDNPQVQYHVGMAYAQTGDHANARKALTAAANSGVVFPGKEEARKALAGLR
jgi:cytochrome c-type biogenesis protein CcmH/NrfG